MESQPGRDAPEKAAQTKLPTPPPIQPLWVDPVDHKRKREENGKEVAKIGRAHPFYEVEPQRGAKQPSGLQTRSANEVGQRGNHRVATPT